MARLAGDSMSIIMLGVYTNFLQNAPLPSPPFHNEPRPRIYKHDHLRIARPG